MKILKAAAVSLLLVLPACSSVGPMLASVGIAGASIAGKAFSDRAHENIADRIIWRSQKRIYIQAMASEILSEARERRRADDFKGWQEMMDKLLAFHEEQYPDLLVVQYAKRLNKLEGEANE